MLDIVDDVVGPLVDAGRAIAELTLADDAETPSELDLRPAKPRAAPLHLAFDAPGVLYVSLDRHGTHFEVVERSDDVFAASVREIVTAVVAGRYRERVGLRPDGALKAQRACSRLLGPNSAGSHSGRCKAADRRAGAMCRTSRTSGRGA